MSGVANDGVKISSQVFRMRRKSAKSLSAARSVGETLELGEVAVSFWLPGRAVVIIQSYGICGHGSCRNFVST